MYKTKACLVIPNIDMTPTWVPVMSNSSPGHVEFEFGILGSVYKLVR